MNADKPEEELKREIVLELDQKAEHDKKKMKKLVWADITIVILVTAAAVLLLISLAFGVTV